MASGVSGGHSPASSESILPLRVVSARLSESILLGTCPTACVAGSSQQAMTKTTVRARKCIGFSRSEVFAPEEARLGLEENRRGSGAGRPGRPVVGEAVVVAEHRVVLASPDDRKHGAGVAGMRSKSGRLAEGAGGFVVHRKRERLPPAAYKGKRTRGGDTRWRGRASQEQGEPDQYHREHPGEPPHYAPSCHRLKGAAFTAQFQLCRRTGLPAGSGTRKGLPLRRPSRRRWSRRASRRISYRG